MGAYGEEKITIFRGQCKYIGIALVLEYWAFTRQFFSAMQTDKIRPIVGRCSVVLP